MDLRKWNFSKIFRIIYNLLWVVIREMLHQLLLAIEKVLGWKNLIKWNQLVQWFEKWPCNMIENYKSSAFTSITVTIPCLILFRLENDNRNWEREKIKSTIMRVMCPLSFSWEKCLKTTMKKKKKKKNWEKTIVE